MSDADIGKRVRVVGSSHTGKEGVIMSLTAQSYRIDFDDGSDATLRFRSVEKLLHSSDATLSTNVYATPPRTPRFAEPHVSPSDAVTQDTATPARVKVENTKLNLEDASQLTHIMDLVQRKWPSIFAKLQHNFMPATHPVSEWKDGNMGSLTNGRLIATVDHKGDITQELIHIGAKISEHVPICTPSFASKDLAYNGKNYDGCDNRAGRDPWGICDYIRDNLHWPTGAIFIDTEQFATYCHPAEGYNLGKPSSNLPARTYHITPESHPSLKPGTYNVHMVDEDTDDHTTVKRNYRSVYKWAQRNSPVNLFFLSKEWLQSENCTVELDDMKDGLYYNNPDRMVILVFLDRFQGEDQAKIDRYSADLQKLYPNGRFKTFDVSYYMDWLDGGGKMTLRVASQQIQALRDALREKFGFGDSSVFMEEKRKMTQEANTPAVLKLDLNGQPVRNRFRAKYQRRIDINTASFHDMKDCIPQWGEVTVGKVIAARPFKDLRDLQNISGIGTERYEGALPFITCYSLGEGQEQDESAAVTAGLVEQDIGDGGTPKTMPDDHAITAAFLEDHIMFYKKSGSVDERCKARKRNWVNKDGALTEEGRAGFVKFVQMRVYSHQRTEDRGPAK